MTQPAWPYPGDGPTARARRVAHAYRATLQNLVPKACQALDDRMRSMGQHWVVPHRVAIEPDEWVSAADAAQLACVKLDAIRQMRHRGRLTGRKLGGRWEYQVRDILNAFAKSRSRNRPVTDTLTTNGTRMPNPPENQP